MSSIYYLNLQSLHFETIINDYQYSPCGFWVKNVCFLLFTGMIRY